MNYITLAKVEKIFEYSDYIREFIFSIEFERKYNPGSFVQIAIGEISASDIWPESRTFSIASYENGYMRFIIKNEGNFTQKIFNELKVGSICTIKYPFGDLFDKTTINDQHIFLAGGIGITPFLGLIDYFQSINKLDNIYLFYSVQKEEDLIHLDLMKKALMDRLKVYITREPSEKYNSRRMNMNEILSIANQDSHFYVCGSKTFNSYFKNELISRSYNNLHMDEWE